MDNVASSPGLFMWGVDGTEWVKSEGPVSMLYVEAHTERNSIAILGYLGISVEKGHGVLLFLFRSCD